MKAAAILPTLMLLAGILRAQAPSPKPGSVDGAVSNSTTGEPVKKATVTLLGTRAGAGSTEPSTATAMTDAVGHFHFDNVAPGYYNVSADRDGFMAARTPLATRNTVTVGEEQHVQDVAIKLMPMGTVSGRVLDDDGDPIVRAQVGVLRYFYNQGRKRLNQVAFAQSNDLGEFEALNLAPGKYYIYVTIAQPRSVPLHTRWTHPEEAYPVTFYPNAREAAQATAANVTPGAHITNIDFRLRKQPSYHIRGTVSLEGHDARGTVTVGAPEAGFMGRMGGAPVQPDASFDLPGLVSGAYIVTYTQFGSSSRSATQQTVRISDADVNGLALTHTPEVNVSGTVTIEGSQPDKLNVQLTLSSAQGLRGGGYGLVGPDGRFGIAAISPETYQLQIANVPSGKYVKSIRFGDREINSGEIDLTSGSSASLNIVLGQDGGEVDGNVQTASGQPAPGTLITLAPAEEYDGRSDLLKRASTDPSGNFHIKDVAPGEYKVLAWESDPDDVTQSSEFRKPFESKGVSVTVGAKDKASVQLSVISADDIEKESSKLP